MQQARLKKIIGVFSILCVAATQAGGVPVFAADPEEEVAEIVRPPSYIPQGVNAGTELFPPNPKPGACYARVLVPAQYKNETVTLLKSEASERLETIPAKFETVLERVLVKEASERIEVVPATYGWEEERILVKEASEKLVVVPAVYKTVTEQVVDKPAHVRWEKGRGLVEKVDFATGEIICLKKIPATYKTITKRVLKAPATTRMVQIPAQYKTVKRQVMRTPPTTRKIVIPAEYKMQRVVKLVEPAKVNRYYIPEKHQTVSKVVKVADERMAWRPVLCETNITPELVRQIQVSLQDGGYYPGPIDGDIGRLTRRGILQFQKEKGLSRGGLTAETLKELDVELPWSGEELAANNIGG